MKHWFYILTFWGFIAVACDPCNDCGEPIQYDPLVSVIFINQDSANILNDSVAFRNLSIRQIDSVRRILNFNLDSISDSLAVIKALIDEGQTDLEEQRTVLDQSIADILVELEEVNEERDELDSLNRYYGEILALIKSGKVPVEKATLLNNGSVLEYTDSAVVYTIPLLMDANNTSYEFKINDQQIELHFTYTIFETVSDARVFLRRAANINVESPDSITVKCLDPKNCLSDETTVTVYF